MKQIEIYLYVNQYCLRGHLKARGKGHTHDCRSPNPTELILMCIDDPLILGLYCWLQ